jgi:hypothetical protein
MDDRWPRVWSDLRASLAAQPHCKKHPTLPCVATLASKEINDILVIGDQGITVRSHRTGRSDAIPASVFRRWWRHLESGKPASLRPGALNNPDADRSRIVGAIYVTCLPHLVGQDPTDDNVIRVVGA